MFKDYEEEGLKKIEEAKNYVSKGETAKAAKAFHEAIISFNLAIKDAQLNNKTNFVKQYEAKKKEIEEILKTLKASYYKNQFSDEEVIKPVKKKAISPVKDIVVDKPIIIPKMDIETTEKGNELIENTQEENELIKESKKNKKSKEEKKETIEDENINFIDIDNQIHVKLGNDEKGALVYWLPMEGANQHLAAVGMSGTGKTTVVRTVMKQLEAQNVPLIIFDLHDDFKAKRVINFSDITINPLELDGLTPKEKAIEFAYICKRIFKLGDQQENKLREAIVYCYEKKGIIQTDKSSYSLPVPTLADVNDMLESARDGKTVDTLLGRVKFFHRVELFMSETRCPFNEMFTGSTVIKLIEFSDNPDLQTALCEIFLNKLLFTVKKSGQSKLRAYCVIDEAHTLDDGKDSFRSPLVKIAREARKYGLGLILASQMPKDFSKSVLHNIATIITLKFNAREEARAISEHMFGLTDVDILQLGEFGEGYVKLSNGVKKVKFFQQKDVS